MMAILRAQWIDIVRFRLRCVIIIIVIVTLREHTMFNISAICETIR